MRTRSIIGFVILSLAVCACKERSDSRVLSDEGTPSGNSDQNPQVGSARVNNVFAAGKVKTENQSQEKSLSHSEIQKLMNEPYKPNPGWELAFNDMRAGLLTAEQAFSGELPPLLAVDEFGSADGLALSGGFDYSIKRFDSSVKDQGNRLTCTAFAVAAAIENRMGRLASEGHRYAVQAKKLQGLEFDVSEEYIWWRQGQQAPAFAQALGISLGAASRNWMVGEGVYPYNGLATMEITPNVGFVRVSGWTHLDNIISTSIRDGNPVVAVLATNSSWFANYTGAISADGTKTGSDHTYHAVEIVAVKKGDDGTGYFTIKNSWGYTWGDKGYAYVPLNYCEKWYCKFAALTQITLADALFQE